MSKEFRVGELTRYLGHAEFSLNKLLSQEEQRGDFDSYLSGVNSRRASVHWLNRLTGNEIGVKIAFAFKTKQPELRQSALDYLEARGNLLDQGGDPKELILDLAICDLSRADLRAADLRQANLKWTDLTETNLSGANLWGANLSGANLWGASLKWADLSRADLRAADLEWADLEWANFTGAKLERAELQALNKIDKRQGDLLAGASGLIRNGSGRITGVESLPDPEPETPEVKEETNEIMNQVVTLLVAMGHENPAVCQEAAKALIKGLKDLEIHPTNEQTRS
jgi:uncharacterized protein YbdZ (MbtH family)